MPTILCLGFSSRYFQQMIVTERGMSAWQAKWKKVGNRQSGGQGTAMLVSSIETGNDDLFFLKVLSDDASTERRGRIYREVSCYRTLQHHGIPKLVDANEADFTNKSIPLYVVTEYVPGENLGDYVRRLGPRPADEAIDTICRLLKVIEYAHANDTVHRDIKPENIMLRSSDPRRPMVVDFGMAYATCDGMQEICNTELGSEIGNRFLRLPEFAPNQPNKRDPRSDLTHCAGLLLFMLTKNRPVQLVNENGKSPHRTEVATAALAKITSIDIFQLLSFFDRAFKPNIAHRWQSAQEMLLALRDIAIGPTAVTKNIDEMAEAIRRRMRSQEEQEQLTKANAIDIMLRILMSGAKIAVPRIGGQFNVIQESISQDSNGMLGRVGIGKKSNSNVRFLPLFESRFEVDEIALSIINDQGRKSDIFRCPIEDLAMNGAKLEGIITDILVAGVYKLLSSTEESPEN